MSGQVLASHCQIPARSGDTPAAILPLFSKQDLQPRVGLPKLDVPCWGPDSRYLGVYIRGHFLFLFFRNPPSSQASSLQDCEQGVRNFSASTMDGGTIFTTEELTDTTYIMNDSTQHRKQASAIVASGLATQSPEHLHGAFQSSGILELY